MQTTNTREVMAGEQPVICRELTVLQVRDWIEAAAQESDVDLVAEVLFPTCSLSSLKRMTDLTDERINKLRPSQVNAVIDVCRELNPDFFALLGRLSTKPRPAL
ncbi:MAG: hypothetical protein Q8R10_19585 [Pseudomonas sp.]|uniref:hypothetical protein n=1 Tax=Pseudomonas sp. TaxID=306 RepID=UPI002734E745|nr:hypothetical protein [Pseudomonas sp.]MDP3848627.1 hypothetical protein [Pseudomonas sp.]